MTEARAASTPRTRNISIQLFVVVRFVSTPAEIEVNTELTVIMSLRIYMKVICICSLIDIHERTSNETLCRHNAMVVVSIQRDISDAVNLDWPPFQLY